VKVCTWSAYPSDSGLIAYDDNTNPASGQIVYYEFDYLAAGTNRADLLENTVSYLLASEAPPTGSISGTVLLDLQPSHEGILVTAGSSSTYTNAAGYYVIENMYAGTYTVQATKDGWSTGVVEGVVVTEGQQTSGVNMVLYPTVTVEQCENPELTIPDSNTTGVYDTMVFTEDMTITDIEIYVNITHTYIGDLIVEIRSPEGTTVRLHNRGGGSADNLIGWYDSQLAVSGPGALADFIGEQSGGEWRIWVSDNAGGDIGVLHTWCVQVVGGMQTGVPEWGGETPARYELVGASPNPFNPVTSVTYAAPQDGQVLLAVYNVAGQLVRTLVDGDVTAGYHEAVWDGRDATGAPAASGVYFARMEAEGFRASAKMVLLK